MRNGKPLTIVLFGLIVIWFLEPTWQWYWGRLLDSIASDKHGVIHAVLSGRRVSEPMEQYLLGAISGVSIAMLIGYSQAVHRWLRRISLLVIFLPILLWDARRSPHWIAFLGLSSAPGEEEMRLHMPTNIELVSVAVDRKIVYLHRKEKGFVILQRARGVPLDKRLEVEFSLLGRWYFWASIRKWIELDIAAHVELSIDNVWTAFSNLRFEYPETLPSPDDEGIVWEDTRAAA